MRQSKKLKRISLPGLWLTVALLMILILATLVLLGTFIMGYAGGDPNVIEVMADSSAMEKEYSDKFPFGALPDMKTEDAKVQWETETSVDLFKTAYTGTDGSVTVESGNGDKVIAPGTDNTYFFTLKNTGNIALDYMLVLEGVFRLDDKDIPMFVRLSREGAWIIGNENEWLHVKEMNEVAEINTLPRGDAVTYLFEWMWPYETDAAADILTGDIMDTMIVSDQRDTELGSVPSGVETQFLLNIEVTSEIAAAAIAEFRDGAPVLPRFALVCSMIGLIIGSGLWLLILLFLRRNIYFTGLLTPPVPGRVTMDKKNAELSGGRFTFKKTRLGRHKLNINGGELKIRFKHRRKTVGVAVESAKGTTVIYMGSKIRAVELYFAGGTVSTVKWAAIDKKHNVYTPTGMIPAVNKRNRTPGGLTVDEEGRYGA